MNNTLAPVFTMRTLEGLADGCWQPDALSDERNALGVAPLSLLYLWVFERPDSLCAQLVSHGWTRVGPVRLLLSPDARVRGPILRNEHDIRDAVARFSRRAGRHACPQLIDFEVSADYHGYPINYLWCTDAVWRTGFDALLASCERVLVDLTAEEPPSGLCYELGRIFERVPASDIVLLVDRSRGDLELVQTLLEAAWRGVGKTDADRPPVLIGYRTASLKYLAQASMSQWTGKACVRFAGPVAHHAGWDR